MLYQSKSGPGNDSTVTLVRQAKDGDRSALAELLDRYYKGWLRRYHGRLGVAVRRLYDTQDLVQSAIADAVTDLPSLENEPAFFTWVTSIIRHKHAKRYRQLKKELSLDERTRDNSTDVPGPEAGPESQAEAVDRYLHTLEVILSLFPAYPEPMAVCVLRHLDGCSMPQITERLRRPRTTVYRWLREGTKLLRARLER